MQDKTRAKIYLVGINQVNQTSQSRQIKVFRIDTSNQNNLVLEKSTDDLHTKELVPGDRLQDLHCVDGQIRMVFFNSESAELSGYKTIIYQKKRLGCSSTVFEGRLN